jgi:hypothetical protein
MAAKKATKAELEAKAKLAEHRRLLRLCNPSP